MKLKMGQIYRYSKKGRSGEVEYIDNLPNYFYYTNVNNFESTFTFQKGIHCVKTIRTNNGETLDALL